MRIITGVAVGLMLIGGASVIGPAAADETVQYGKDTSNTEAAVNRKETFKRFRYFAGFGYGALSAADETARTLQLGVGLGPLPRDWKPTWLIRFDANVNFLADEPTIRWDLGPLASLGKGAVRLGAGPLLAYSGAGGVGAGGLLEAALGFRNVFEVYAEGRALYDGDPSWGVFAGARVGYGKKAERASDHIAVKSAEYCNGWMKKNSEPPIGDECEDGSAPTDDGDCPDPLPSGCGECFVDSACQSGTCGTDNICF